jgi:hypothetical protein
MRFQLASTESAAGHNANAGRVSQTRSASGPKGNDGANSGINGLD